MNIKVFVDSQCGYNFYNISEKLIKQIQVKTNNKNIKLIIVFSNNLEYIKGICKVFPKPNVVINITENFSEYHMIHTLKYVTDIYLLRSNNVNILIERVIKKYVKECNEGKDESEK